jgi:hypothetical protein
MRAIITTLAVAMLCLGCGKADEAKDKAKGAADKAKDTAKGAADKAKDTAKGAADKVKGAADTVKDETLELAGKASGLGGDVVSALTPGALAMKGGIEDIVLRGKQVGGVAEEIGTVWSTAVDSDTTIKPIYQKLDDEQAMKDTDAAIGDMPRSEVINGLTVGFKDLTMMENATRTTDSGYLVVWRSEDRLIGFVYRSKKTIDFEVLVKETPKLIKLVGKIL